MIISHLLLDELTEKAKASPRQRMHFDLRDSVEDESQRMLNAVEPETVIPVHRHSATSEDVVILRGKAVEIFFDNDGQEVSRCYLAPDGSDPESLPVVHVPMGQYHTLQSLESGTVVIEFKNGKYDPLGTEEYL